MRQKVLLKHVGVPDEPVAEQSEVVVHRLAARDEAGLGGPQRLVARLVAGPEPREHLLLRRPFDPLPEAAVSGEIEEEPRDRRVLLRLQRRQRLVVLLGRLVGVDDHLIEEADWRCGEVAEHHAVAVVRGDHLVERRGEVGGRDGALGEPVHLAGHQAELRLDDHPEEPVAADPRTEQVGSFSASCRR